MASTQQWVVRAAVGACALTALAGCGGGGGGGGTQTAGTLGVSLTDAPSCGFDKVFVTVTKVRVHKSAAAGTEDDGWTEIAVDPAKSKIDLLSLANGVLQPLGQVPLAAGHYSQLRLVLNKNSGNGLANSVIPTGQTNEVPLVTPSAVESGLKLVNEFDIEAGQRADLVLDFDACKSIVTRGNGEYALKPVVKVIPTLLNGVEGYVGAGLTDVHVSAQQNGEIISSTAPDSEGHFYLSRLPVGAYDVVITASDRATTVVGAVPVTSPTATTMLGTKAAPISLLAAPEARKISGTVNFMPPGTDAAYVYASQTLPAGSKITIKYRASDASGNYTLSDLPKVAPQYAPYNATALVFAAQAGIKPGVGQYAVQASATGYKTTASTVVDISQGNQAGVNFTLTQ
ncbi:DUF4382 domain-containing protein|uniref:DUF4382 domain-containing protein n=1 Tax=Noviherbaspirillum sp. L7-7A TaxID=2850560 RepID=UPI001C2C34F0|nr:DUF4382 domain-containing protein [Noviherbaspirillum sp. L7-7A]MBV0880257.1 DUF4382 domain-containing protein [Noviherbaspirillum sp. L7-7A]